MAVPCLKPMWVSDVRHRRGVGGHTIDKLADRHAEAFGFKMNLAQEARCLVDAVRWLQTSHTSTSAPCPPSFTALGSRSVRHPCCRQSHDGWHSHWIRKTDTSLLVCGGPAEELGE